MFLKVFIRVILVAIILASIGIGIVDYLKNFDQNECSMTYMYEYPRLIPIMLEDDSYFINYKLYLYCEGYFCQKYENLNFKETGLVPILFITGNADSHMQVRSLASISLDKSKTKYPKKKFLFFTISFNEELSALYGPVIEKQTLYARKCIRKILSLFDKVAEPHRPKKVLVIGNSMGGIVARNILVLSNDDGFDMNSVDTIITKSSPHVRPVINIDSKMAQLYQDMNNFWLNSSENGLKNVVLVSLYGGHRDILVRSGLSNINDWNNQSVATVISSYTPSIPFVWRSIDHKCMAWCREFILTVTRALFDLVDPRTGQIYENKEIRSKILAQHFDGTRKSSKIDKIKIDGHLSKINERSNFFYEFNSYNPDEKKFLLFDLSILKNDFDSLFIYTNLNGKNLISLCENIHELHCLNPLDLASQYGQVIPPLFENREMSLKFINLNNLIKLKQKYKFLLINIPIRESHEPHQIVLKVDWYKMKERFSHLTNELADIELNLYPTFSRLYLPSIKNIFQVYSLEKNPKINSCDSLLLKEIENKNYPLLSSCLMVILNEKHAKQTINSESIQIKSKNIAIKLSKNVKINESIYIEIIKFDPMHLLKSNKKIDKIDANAYRISFKYDLIGTLGQFIRFYGIFFPAFLTSILQFYDIISLRASSSASNVFLEHHNKNFKIHLYLIGILISLNFLPTHLETDLEILSSESLNFTFMPLFMHLSSYAILIILSFFITAFSFPIKLIANNIILKILPFLSSTNFKLVLRFCSIILFITACFYTSALAICFLFYLEFLTIILNKTSNLFDQTKLFFMYFLMVLNVPGLIVWAKSISNFSIQPIGTLFEDCALETAQCFVVIVVLNWIKFDAGMMQKFSLDKKIVSILLFTNLLMTVLYSMINLYRLQYFILAHLLIVFLRPNFKLEKNESDKKKQE